MGDERIDRTSGRVKYCKPRITWSVVWGVAGLVAVSLAVSRCGAAADGLANDCLVAGRFGMAFDAAKAEAESGAPSAAFKKFPLTVELWCKLNSSDEFNILVSCEPKESADHWELYSEGDRERLARICRA
jgi:hypothetical protein